VGSCYAPDLDRMLTSLLGKLESWHSARFMRPWFGPLAITRGLILAALVMALIAVFANVKVRYQQGQVWKATPEITEIAGAMSFSTADAPYFLGHAAAAERGLSPDDFMRKRIFPNTEMTYRQRPDDAPPSKRPLLSTLISSLSPSDNPGDLLRAGHAILIVNAGLTALMITLAFGATGYWLEGTAAAMGGGLSSAYLLRSSFGRIDTDQLNLGLMYLMFAFVMLSARSKTVVATLIWAVAASATAGIFMAWYGKPELIWMAMAAYFWLLTVLRKDIKVAAPCLLLFYTLAPVSLPNPFASAYVQDNFAGGNFLFPNTLRTITETAPISLSDILISATGSVQIGLVCLIGLGLWAIRHPVMAFAYGPLVTFALLNFVIGNRAVFYSAPILWFGFAFLLTSIARFVVQIALSSPENNAATTQDSAFPRVINPATIAIAALAMIIAWLNAPTNYLPHPSFPKPVLQGLVKIKNITTSDQSVVASWWDYGYASIFLNDLPTLHDGGSQTGPATHFFAQTMLGSDQASMVGTLQFLLSNGDDVFQRHKSKTDLFAAFDKPKTGTIPDIYLVLTSEMADWIGSISLIGNWDIETGQPMIPSGNNGVSHVEYIGLGCNYRGFPARIACDNVTFDFDRGLMNDAPAIVGWTRTRDGFAQEVRRYSADATFGVQTLQTNNRIFSQLMHRQLYDSSFNKLYHLGLIEAQGITMVYDNYPHIRIYRIAGSH